MKHYLFSLSLLLIPLKLIAAVDLISIAQSENARTFAVRQHLHEHPETAWEENASLAYIKSALSQIKPIAGRTLTIQDQFEGGLVADLIIDPTLKTRLFRADIDALNVHEDDNHTLKSKIPGKMHACGHDAHSAMLLTATHILATDPAITITSNIRFIWQRAEENPNTDPVRISGAYTFVKEGLLENIDEVYGLHVWSKFPSGTLYSANKAIMGTADRLEIKINTTGGHSSSPHQGTNALRVANAVINALREVHVRLVGPIEPVSLEPTVLHTGTVSNVMPAEAVLQYTLRTFLQPAPLAELRKQLSSLIEQVAHQYDAETQITFETGYPVTMNTPDLYQQNKAHLIAHGLIVEDITPILAAEDFSFYLQNKPGVFWILGANQPSSGPHHAPTFNPDPASFHKGVALWLLLASR